MRKYSWASRSVRGHGWVHDVGVAADVVLEVDCCEDDEDMDEIEEIEDDREGVEDCIAMI